VDNFRKNESPTQTIIKQRNKISCPGSPKGCSPFFSLMFLLQAEVFLKEALEAYSTISILTPILSGV
jgi:hypothetical protein